MRRAKRGYDNEHEIHEGGRGRRKWWRCWRGGELGGGGVLVQEDMKAVVEADEYKEEKGKVGQEE